MKKISIRVHGQAEFIRFRTFERVEWESILNKNAITQKEFIDQLFDPEFFQKYDFPDFLNQKISASKDEFFGTNMFYGPLTNQMAIVEVKLARKKLYRGTLNRFLGIDAMFPLVNTIEDRKQITQTEGYITVAGVERVAGQVVNSFSICEEFNPELFKVKMSELKFDNYSFSLISSFNYDEKLFKELKSDYVVRNQWAFVI